MNFIYERLIKGICTKSYWVKPFPKCYDSRCFDCKKTSCKECPFK